MLIHLSDSARLFHADCRDAIRSLPDNSIDSVVTDPPYALVSIVKRFGGANAAPAKGNDAYMRASAGFMNQRWDTGETAFSTEFWAEVLRVLKPGGHVAAFGASRGYHRVACAIEDAGFEIRDSLMWVYGTGFPKSHDVSKGIDRAAGAEREVVGINEDWVRRKPNGSASENSVGFSKETDYNIYAPATDAARQWEGWGTALKPAFEPIVLARKPLSESTVAANVLRWGTGALNIDGCRVPCDDKTPFPVGANSADGSIKTGLYSKPRGDDTNKDGRWPANVVHDGSDEVVGMFPMQNSGTPNPNLKRHDSNGVTWTPKGGQPKVSHGGRGSAARFFYSAKASRADRAGSKHPTVKPIALMEWLATLITPPGGTILDPFAGSGTTGAAAARKGFSVILCEREAEYVEDIKRRFDPNAAPVEALRNVNGGRLDVIQPDPLTRLLTWNAAVASYHSRSKVAA